MAPIPTFVTCKADIALENKNYSTTLESKELMDIVEPICDGRESLPSRSESGSEKPPRRNSSKHHSRRRHNRRETKDINRHFSSPKSLNDKYDSRLGSELEGDDHLTPKQDNGRREYENPRQRAICLLTL